MWQDQVIIRHFLLKTRFPKNRIRFGEANFDKKGDEDFKNARGKAG